MLGNKLLVAGAAALVLGAAACGSSTKAASAPPPTSAPPTTAATQPAPAPAANPLASVGPATATGMTVSLAKSSQGIFLIGPNGHSLYVFDSDHGTTSACTSSCAAVWPGLSTAGSITSGQAINQTQVTKAAGQVANQVTYFGHLLYFFSGDQMPGQTNGTTIPGWHLLGPFGNVMLPRT